MSKLVDKYKYDLFLQIDNSDIYELYLYYNTTRCHQLVAYLCILRNDFSFFEASKMEIINVVAGKICDFLADLLRRNSDVHCR